MRRSTIQTAFRLDGLDTARGVAIALMFLSHTVKSLLSFAKMPAWGIVPVHAITKFSSSLFIIVFGVTLCITYLPKVGTAVWPAARWALIRRGALVMFWYKALIVVQMFQRSNPKIIVDTLLWRRFPDFVEVLQFYAWFVLLLPLILPLWKRLPVAGRVGLVAVFGISGYALQSFDFWGIWQLKAVLVETDHTFCFGVITRGTMALAALLFGGLFLDKTDLRRTSTVLGLVSVLLGLGALALFYHLRGEQLYVTLRMLAKNWGKHPPELVFLLWSSGGALLLLGFFLLLRGPALSLFRPFTIIGRESLFSFNLHIILVFVGVRYLLDLRRSVTYEQALMITGGVFVAAVVFARLNTWRKELAKQVDERAARAVDDAEPPRSRGRGRFGNLSPEEAAVASQFDAASGRSR